MFETSITGVLKIFGADVGEENADEFVVEQFPVSGSCGGMCEEILFCGWGVGNRHEAVPRLVRGLWNENEVGKRGRAL